MSEKCIIAAVKFKNRSIYIDYQMAELANLVEAAGGEVISSVVQERERADNKYYFGKGKIEEIKILSEELDADTVVINNELSPAQIKNISDIINAKIVDRTGLILDIFSLRAKTRESRYQVELAQLKYKLPRLKGMGSQMSRLAGGIGTRGPGETKLESDRRHIERRILQIEKKLEDAEKNREVTRKKRLENNIPIVAVIGYTNSGKSTLINSLLDKYGEAKEKKVFSYDMLFATLTSENRKIILEEKFPVIITDTVGFVSELPTLLIESFKSTLEEVKYADLIIHLIDISSKENYIHKKTTESILEEINAVNIERIDVYNKIDLTGKKEISSGETICISAKTGYQIENLAEKIAETLYGKKTEKEIVLDSGAWADVGYLEKYSDIISREYTDKKTVYKVIIREKIFAGLSEGRYGY